MFFYIKYKILIKIIKNNSVYMIENIVHKIKYNKNKYNKN